MSELLRGIRISGGATLKKYSVKSKICIKGKNKILNQGKSLENLNTSKMLNHRASVSWRTVFERFGCGFSTKGSAHP